MNMRLHSRHCRPRGNVGIAIHDARTDAVLERYRGHNLVVSAGLNAVRDGLNSDAVADPIIEFGLGSGSVEVTSLDTALGSEILPRRPVARFTAADGLLTVQLHITSAQLNGQNIREIGLFTLSNRLYARYVLGTVAQLQPKTAAHAATFTWDLTWDAPIDATLNSILQNAATTGVGSAVDTQMAFPELLVSIIGSPGVSAGEVTITEAHNAAYAGAWSSVEAPIAVVANAVITRRLSGAIRAIRAEITDDIVDGSVTVTVQGQGWAA